MAALGSTKAWLTVKAAGSDGELEQGGVGVVRRSKYEDTGVETVRPADVRGS